MSGWHYICTACSKQRVLLWLMCMIATFSFCDTSLNSHGISRPHLRGGTGWDKSPLGLGGVRGRSVVLSEGATAASWTHKSQRSSQHLIRPPYDSLDTSPIGLHTTTVSSSSQQTAWHQPEKPEPHDVVPTAAVDVLTSTSHAVGRHKLSRRHLLQELQQGSSDSSSSSSQTSSSRSTEQGAPVLPPLSCLNGGKWKYAQLQVQLDMNITTDEEIVDVTNRTAYAVAKQLNLRDTNGELDTSRVEAYVDTINGQLGSALLDVYVYLSPWICEFSRRVWLDHAVKDSATLFAADAQLAAAVTNVTAVIRDPGRLVKSAIQSSANEVISMVLGSNSQDNNSSSSGSTGDGGAAVIQDAGLNYVSPLIPGTTVDGLLVLGATTGSLLAVVLLLMLMQRYAEWRTRRRAQADIAAAVAAATAAATAAVAAAREQAALEAEAGGDSDSDSESGIAGVAASPANLLSSGSNGVQC